MDDQVVLKDREWPSTIDTSSADLISDFFVPALARSIQYDRGVGFFSSGWLRETAKGMIQFAKNGGTARWVTSPILTAADWEALKIGDDARNDPILRKALKRNMNELAIALEEDTLSALAWMVADGILSFRLALPHRKLTGGDFHDKFGIFTDSEGNRLSFNGSYNESVQGIRNYESLKLFPDWNEVFLTMVEEDSLRFERLWNNLDPNVVVYDLSDAEQKKILRLRTKGRPYKVPTWIEDSEEHFFVSKAEPRLPENITLRDYQEEAIEAWFANECCGLLEMATGTGKTFTALSAAVHLVENIGHVLVVISCPYKHLVNQWANEATKFGFRPTIVAESKAKWEGQLSHEIRAFRKRYTDVVTVITTNRALQMGTLQPIVEECWPEALLIMDEVHYAGAPSLLQALPQKAPWRLGLSATPIRHYDTDGTEAVLDYFKDIVYSFPLEEAIGKYLTPYYYYPIPVEMTIDEFGEFSALTDKLRKFAYSEDEQFSEAAQRIAIRRARVLNNSTSKLKWLNDNIEDHAGIEFTLFYVGDKIFGDVLQLLGAEKHIRVHEFTHRVSANEERQRILRRFSEGDLQALVAMRCLDEGVDVPPTRTAYFLASSGNPREFIQRRGRILRLYEGKDHATVIDLISIPPMEIIEQRYLSPHYGAVRSAVRREYKRVKEFASLALNHFKAMDEVFQIAEYLDLLDE